MARSLQDADDCRRNSADPAYTPQSAAENSRVNWSVNVLFPDRLPMHDEYKIIAVFFPNLDEDTYITLEN